MGIARVAMGHTSIQTANTANIPLKVLHRRASRQYVVKIAEAASLHLESAEGKESSLLFNLG